MKNTQKTLASLAFALVIPAAACAQGKLILPSGQDDISKLMETPRSGPCEKCGVITDVRSERRQVKDRDTMAPVPSSGIGSGIKTTPIIGSGTAVKDARSAHQPETFYKMTVRYDDGTYAFFEQDDEPSVRKGDKVEVIDGRVVRQAD
ncbi:MAG: hypothetical protein QM739_05635 [Propionivibrio sp.]